MRRVGIALAGIAAALLLSSCGTTVETLYSWGGYQNGTTAYENLAYLSYDKQSPQSICGLVAVYENMVSHPGGSRRVPPPGICAEYGYLLLQPGTAETFTQNASSSQKSLFGSSDYAVLFREKGQEMLEKEVEYYPESARFIEPLIKKLAK